MTEESSGTRGGSTRQKGSIGEGVRSGLGILTAFKEAIEETIQDAVDKGELSPERARDTMRTASRRVQDGIEEARERLDLVPRRDFDRLREEVAELRRRLDALEPALALPPPPGASQIPIDAE